MTAFAARAARMVVYVPADAYVEGQGYRVSIVRENEPGHYPTGSWPYEGKPGQTMPWFWGPTYEDACHIADEHNGRLGLTKEDALKIVLSSMFPPKEKSA